MAKLTSIFVAFIALAFSGVSTPASSETLPPLSTPEDMVWHWSDKSNNGNLLKITVFLDGKVIYETTLPISLLHRYEIKPAPKQNILEFFFVENRPRVFDAEDPVPRISEPNQEIGCNIWEAGSEKDAILLGVTFVTQNKILLNTIHLASMKEDSESELAEGIVVKSSIMNNQQ